MGFPVFSWFGAGERTPDGSNRSGIGYESQRDGLERVDVSSEMISTATGFSLEEIRELFD